MSPELPTSLKTLANDARAYGMTLRVVESPPSELLNDLLSHFGFAHPDEDLSPISRDQAADLIAHLVAYDQAFGHPTRVIDIAEDCGHEFVGLFPRESRFFTNSADSIFAPIRTWRSLTDATFDSGVLVVSTSRAGVLWFEDED